MRMTTVRQQQQYQRPRAAVIVLIIFFIAANNVKVKCEKVVEEEKEEGAAKVVGAKHQQQQQRQLEIQQSRLRQQQQLEQAQPQSQSQVLQQLERFNFLVGIASVGVRHENATKCSKELEVMLKAIVNKEFWTLKLLDSFGVTPKSFQWGNYFWFSAQQLCDDLNTPYSISLSKREDSVYNLFNVTSPVPLSFTVIYLQFSTPHYIDIKLTFENLIHLGLCLPRSCSSSVLQQYTNSYFRNEGFDMQRTFEMKLKVVDVRTPSFKWSFFKQTGSILFTIILFLVILFPVVAEIIHKTKIKLRNQRHIKTPATPKSSAMQQSQEKSSKLEMILLCFRISENYKRAIRLENASTGNFLGVIDGMRTVICLWVTVFHVYYYSLYTMSNAPMSFAKLEYFVLQPVMQACFYVDIFFIISAFLLVYNFLSNQLQMKQIQHNNIIENAKLFFKAILCRYMRLTPVLIITMLLSDMVSDFLNMYSPFHLGVHSGIYCKNNWWYNLLYIQNLLDMKNICCSWTWYLSCEMQYFILFTALLYLYAKNAKAAKIAFAILALGFVVAGWVCNYRNGITFQLDVINSTLNQLYIKPWVRIIPYVGGAAFGWVFHRYRHHQHQQHPHQNHRPSLQQLQQQQQQGSSYQHHNQQEDEVHGVELHAVWRAAFWLFCAIVYVTTNFMSYWRTTPSWLVATIMSFGKLLFALCIGGVISLCARGYGGIFNTLLNARILLFLSKFCFSIYMVAPVIVYAAFGLRNEATNFTEVGSTMDFVAVTSLSIISAFLLVLLVEIPVQRISNAFLKNSQKNEIAHVNGSEHENARSVAS